MSLTRAEIQLMPDYKQLPRGPDPEMTEVLDYEYKG